MTQIKQSILETIGNTPIVKINNLTPEGVDIFVKLEAFNPMGSVKDRLALGVIEAAERDGSLKPGQTIVEATSGNTGIGLAMVCAQKGYPLVVTMAESFSIERRKLLRFMGAKVVLTPAAEKGSGMVAKARELAEKHGWFMPCQFENPANADIHSATTAQEILRDFGLDGLDYWVTGFGTGGTLTGVARVLKAQSPGTQIVSAEPDNAQLMGSGIVQSFNADGSAAASHPEFRPHPMQGWSPDFISDLANQALEGGLIDRMQPVAGADAMAMAKALARKEGIFCGITGGATFAAALEIAKTAPKGSKILAMLPDTGERYLSTPLFEDVPEEMTAEEMALSQSTQGARFDMPTSAAPADAAQAVRPEAIEAVRQISADKPVVVFALEWCEFCWSVRKMLAAAGIAYDCIELDGPAWQKDNKGTEMRAALRQITGSPTIPQIFVDGEHIGGATETFDAFNDGSLQDRLATLGLPCGQMSNVNAYSFLPKWVHPR